MTITSTQNRITYAGNGAPGVPGVTAFSVPFRFLAPGDLVVLVRNNATGVDTTKTLDTHYSVTGEGAAAGGTVTFLIEDGEPQTGETLIIYGNPALTQAVDYISGGVFPAETHEQAMDLLTLQQARTRELVERTPGLVEGDTDGSGAYDANSNRIKSLGTPTATTDATTKTYVDALVNNTALGPAPTGLIATGSVTSRTLADRWGEVKNVKDYGAVGNGVANDTAAIVAAESAALTAGATLVFPNGTYNISGSIKLRVSVQGNNSTIKQTDLTMSTTTAITGWSIVTDGTDGALDNSIIFDSLRLDGGAAVTDVAVGQDGSGDPNVTPSSHGWHMSNVDGVIFVNCQSSNVSSQGFLASRCNNVIYERCESHYIYWKTSSADGFYTQMGADIRYINCVSSNFRRIGFVGEGRSDTGAVTEKSRRLHYENCIAHRSLNNDDNLLNHGAGFWIENTLSATFLNCHAYDMYTGIGQTEAVTAIGFVSHLITPSDDDDYAGVVNFIGCKASDTKFGFICSGVRSSGNVVTNLSINYTGCVADNFLTRGFENQGGLASTVYKDCVTSNSTANGSILFNGYSYTREIHFVLDNFKSINNTLSDVDLRLWNDGSAGGTVVIRDCEDISVAANGATEAYKTMTITGSHLLFPSDATAKMAGANLMAIDNCRFSLMSAPASEVSQSLFGTSTRVQCSNTTFELQGNRLAFIPTATSTDIDIFITSCHFKNTTFFPALADANTVIDGCIFDSFDGGTTNGAMIWTDHYAAGNAVLSVANCVFMSSDATDIPLKKKNQQPTHTVLSSNSYNTTVLTDFTNTLATGPYLHPSNNIDLNAGGGLGITALADEATPTVAGGSIFVTSGTANDPITDFDDGVLGQTITILSEHAVTITDGTNIILHGSANFAMAAADSLTLVLKADNKWYETARMVN